MAEKFVSNIIRMMSWTGCWSFLSRFLSIFSALFFLANISAYSQLTRSLDSKQGRYANTGLWMGVTHYEDAGRLQTPPGKLPDPMDVMYRSMFIPGWGQITNKQIWKVPIIYGLLGGLTWYSVYLTKRYHDYRAAYYNINTETPDDMRFGPTPGYLSGVTNLQSLKANRNSLRNQRDFIYISIGLAYGLNIIDAYVFAHMRSFDVSDDLSMKTSIKPAVSPAGTMGISVSVALFNNKMN